MQHLSADRLPVEGLQCLGHDRLPCSTNVVRNLLCKGMMPSTAVVLLLPAACGGDHAAADGAGSVWQCAVWDPASQLGRAAAAVLPVPAEQQSDRRAALRMGGPHQPETGRCVRQPMENR